MGYVAGSLVMVLTTSETVERRALKNPFGILPRKTLAVHWLPEWLESMARSETNPSAMTNGLPLRSRVDQRRRQAKEVSGQWPR